MTERSKRWDVFISHSSRDGEIARRVCDALRAAGWCPFLATAHLSVEVGSAAWSRAIDEALDESAAVLLLVSSVALRSRWVEYEWRSTHDDILGGLEGLLIPVCFEQQLGPRQLPRALRRHQAVDLRKASSFDAGLQRVGDLLRGYLGPPAADRGAGSLFLEKVDTGVSAASRAESNQEFVDRMVHAIAASDRPGWAKSSGRDGYGFYADLELAGLTQRMRLIPGGQFLMGSPERERARLDNEAQHEVSLSPDAREPNGVVRGLVRGVL